MFKNSSADLNENATAVTEFIKKYMDECVPTNAFGIFTSQKPWVNQEIRNPLKARFMAFWTGDPDTRCPGMTSRS